MKRQTWLSVRQTEVIKSIAATGDTAATATELGITRSTVHNHLHDIYRRLNVNNMVTAVIAAHHNNDINIDHIEVVQ